LYECLGYFDKSEELRLRIGGRRGFCYLCQDRPTIASSGNKTKHFQAFHFAGGPNFPCQVVGCHDVPSLQESELTSIQFHYNRTHKDQINPHPLGWERERIEEYATRITAGDDSTDVSEDDDDEDDDEDIDNDEDEEEDEDEEQSLSKTS